MEAITLNRLQWGILQINGDYSIDINVLFCILCLCMNIGVCVCIYMEVDGYDICDI